MRSSLRKTAVWITALLLLLPGAPGAAEAPHIQLEGFLQGLEAPVDFADDGTGTFYIVEQAGVIRRASRGRLDPEPFLDIHDHVLFGGECGLLGLAFHPRFLENGRFFVNYDTQTPDGISTIIAEFKAVPGSTRVDLGTEREIMRYSQPYPNHKGGQIAFGPDGKLYIAAGDGGSGGDPHQNGQSLKTRLAKILRIDVDHQQPYGIPADNPFVHVKDALPEIWAFGLRNPWRFSFDRKTGQLYCGDVGQDTWEEVDIIEKGRNYGWSAREGKHDFKPERAMGGMVDPIKDYSHQVGHCIIGGFVYRGKAIAALRGIYVYADFSDRWIAGLKWDGAALTFDSELLRTPMNISSFGQDKDGELYVCDYGGGRILRVMP